MPSTKMILTTMVLSALTTAIIVRVQPANQLVFGG